MRYGEKLNIIALYVRDNLECLQCSFRYCAETVYFCKRKSNREQLAPGFRNARHQIKVKVKVLYLSQVVFHSHCIEITVKIRLSPLRDGEQCKRDY